VQNKNLTSCPKLENIYENSYIFLLRKKNIEEIYNIKNIIEDIDLIAISMPTVLIINIDTLKDNME
jgi:hypothetical protein